MPKTVGPRLDARLLLSIELALSASCADLQLSRRQDKDAHAIGMTGAEIDMARRGSSFDVKISAAVALALAPSEERRRCARRTGLCERSCMEIEKLAARIQRSLQ
ncbi:hypothetical protein A6U87_07785 [Rhizobium sp. AC44/96]|uniref:hypothetical protein n=1 Tax=unclassified Rhizobium TaxID=2613769 RepID=UPI00080F92CF|nr:MULTISPECIES: hypothetical protein [unclassified Rhizobium]MDM9622936.1 hypothetical protein [Rhizobium sp. S96]OCJ13173.1 hypothetical protein A6U87_07785 [Rhizobium sp. AC44/96]